MIKNSRLDHALTYAAKMDCLHVVKHSKPLLKGWIYFIQCEQYVKIGITRGDIAKRLNIMQVNCPFPLAVLHSIYSVNVVEHEKLLHNMLCMYHHRGEWFALPLDKLQCVLAAFDTIVQAKK